ncbi:MAG: hypothetical protein NTV63_00235 [Candidatus Woesearchaeota archaeon]|nr:hypothetical protein [Candidatus Woesearchaeota archaeon]
MNKKTLAAILISVPLVFSGCSSPKTLDSALSSYGKDGIITSGEVFGIEDFSAEDSALESAIKKYYNGEYAPLEEYFASKDYPVSANPEIAKKAEAGNIKGYLITGGAGLVLGFIAGIFASGRKYSFGAGYIVKNE